MRCSQMYLLGPRDKRSNGQLHDARPDSGVSLRYAMTGGRRVRIAEVGVVVITPMV